jgi:hypothetical protein
MDDSETANSVDLSIEWLASLGYGVLTTRQALMVLRRAKEALNFMVGDQIASQLTPQQLTEFDEYVQSGDEQAQEKFLTSKAPDYSEVVKMTVRSLENELRKAAKECRKKHIELSESF